MIPVFHTDQHGVAIAAGLARFEVDPEKVAARTREYVYEGRLVPLE